MARQGQLRLFACPECGYVFQGTGWTGMAAHWHAEHETIMPYIEAWPLIREGHYPRFGMTS